MRVASLKRESRVWNSRFFVFAFFMVQGGGEGVGWVWVDGDIPGGSFYIKMKKMCCCEGLFTYRKIMYIWFRAKGEG